jgi:pyruvate carboxylase subunit B
MYLGTSTYLYALDAGVNILDVAIYPFSGFFGSPDLLSLLYATKKLDYNIGGLQIDDIIMYQKELAAKVYSKSISIQKEHKSNVFITPFPAIELDEYNKSIDRAVVKNSINDEILHILKILKVKNISQPFSKFIFDQAVLNIKHGRWSVIDRNFASILSVSSIKVEADLAKKLNVMATQKRMDDSIDSYLAQKGVEINLENRFLYSLFDLEEKAEPVYKDELITKKRILGDKEEYCVEVGKKKFLVKIKDVAEEIEVINYNTDVNTEKIVSEYSGTVMSIKIAIGSSIIEGELLMVIWSDGKEYEVVSKIEGIVYNIYVEEGQEIKKGDDLISVEM